MPHKDPKARKAYMDEYNRTRRDPQKIEAYNRKVQQTQEYKDYMREYNANRNKDPNYKAEQKKRRQKNRQKPKVKAKEKSYRQRPEVKNRANKRERERRKNDPEYRNKKQKSYRDYYTRTGGRGHRKKAKELLKRDGPYCGICGKELDLQKFDVDHIIPSSQGGSNHIDNLQLAHPSCNRSKQDRVISSQKTKKKPL